MHGAGVRDRKIVFQRFTSTRDGLNAVVKTWATYATEWAAVSYGTGAERREAAQEKGSQAATFWVPRNTLTAALTLKDRISFDGMLWDIVSKVPTHDNSEIEITAVASSG